MKRVTENNYFELDHGVRELSEQVSLRISEKRKEFGDYSFDPLTIISVANLIIGTIRLIYVCYSNRSGDILSEMRDPGFFQRILIKRQIRKHINNDAVDDAYEALVEQSMEMTEGDIANVLKVYRTNKMFMKRGE
jgi:hypothetical protein